MKTWIIKLIWKKHKYKITTLNVLFPLQTTHTHDSLLSTIDTWFNKIQNTTLWSFHQIYVATLSLPRSSSWRIPTSSQTCAVDISRSLFGVLFFPLNMQIVWKCNKQKFSSSLGSAHSLPLSHSQTCISLWTFQRKLFNKTACVPVLQQANK